LVERLLRYVSAAALGKSSLGFVERETRLELATLCLGSRCSTTELLPPKPC
jgi:hypothetical protein